MAAVGGGCAAVGGGEPLGAARRHCSLPFSPLDGAAAGAQRLPLTPLPLNAKPGGGQLRNGVQPEASELRTMDVWSMRQLIRTAGLKHADCEDIDALRERARQALAGERQLEPEKDDEPDLGLPRFVDENGSELELRRTSMRSSMDGLQPASHRRARVSAPNATPCIRRCSHSSAEIRSDEEDSGERSGGADTGECNPKRARTSAGQACGEDAAVAEAPAGGSAGIDAADAHDRQQLLEMTASAARHSRDPHVSADVLSRRMLYRLTCCAEEIQLEVECSAGDVDWGVAVSAKAAIATLFNAVYLSEFIPARVANRLSRNVEMVHHFVQGYVQCFQAILYLLKQQKLPTAALMRSVLESGEALDGALPSDFVPSHAVYFGVGGCAEYAIDAWLYTSAQEYGQPWWAQDAELQEMPASATLDGNYDAIASRALPIGYKRHTPAAQHVSMACDEKLLENGDEDKIGVV